MCVVVKHPLLTAVEELTLICKTNNNWVGTLCFLKLGGYCKCYAED